MHRLFRSELPGSHEYANLMVDEQLDRGRVKALLNRYVVGNELLIYVDLDHCAFTDREQAFEHIRDFMPHGRVRIADPRFSGRVIVEPMGVGAGCAL